MNLTATEVPTQAIDPRRSELPIERLLFYGLAAVALAYAFLAGLRTVADFDLGWQMATGRWIIEHHQIPSTDVLSYTANGQPWIYPVGSGLIFYGVFLLGGYALLSWLGAAASVGTVLLLLRRSSAVSAGLAVLAVSLIASRTGPRAEMFTMVLFAATLTLLWQHHEMGQTRLWLLPVLMVAWVNLHPGFVAGLALVGAYLLLECVDLISPYRRACAAIRLRHSWPWLIATCGATLVNPFGWGVYRGLLQQEAALGAHSQTIAEWASTPLTWIAIKTGLWASSSDEFYLLLLVLVLAVASALTLRQFGPALVLAGAAIFPIRHTRFAALFAIVVVVVGGAMLEQFIREFQHKILRVRPRQILAIAAAAVLIGFAVVRGTSLVTDRYYRAGTNIASFGAGLSWWFPEKAAAFLDRENVPGQIFNTYNEGGFIAWRLGERYRDYIDGRAIPFGSDGIERATMFMASPPDSPQWKQEASRYDINAIIVPLARYDALQFFPALPQYCASTDWSPVYLDEISAVFVRRGPKTAALIDRYAVNCSTAPLPAAAPAKAGAFNQWANAAPLLRALGRNLEAFTASMKALAIFPDSGYLHFLRGHLYREAGDAENAQQDYILATKFEPNLVAPWSALASFYEERGRFPDAIQAWQTAAAVSRSPWEPLQHLGYANLRAHRPKDALKAFDRAQNSVPTKAGWAVDNVFLANVAHGRARAWDHLGDLERATFFEAQAAQFLPGSADLWSQLAALYDRAGRTEDAGRARAHSQAISQHH